MSNVYTFRRNRSRAAIWAAVGMVALVVAAATVGATQQLIWLAWALGAVTFVWMILPRPAPGIRLDDKALTLSAWSHPKIIKLSQIAYLRANDLGTGPEYAIVFRDGSEEPIYPGDMPDLPIVVNIMSRRGVAVRGIH